MIHVWVLDRAKEVPSSHFLKFRQVNPLWKSSRDLVEPQLSQPLSIRHLVINGTWFLTCWLTWSEHSIREEFQWSCNYHTVCSFTKYKSPKRKEMGFSHEAKHWQIRPLGQRCIEWIASNETTGLWDNYKGRWRTYRLDSLGELDHSGKGPLSWFWLRYLPSRYSQSHSVAWTHMVAISVIFNHLGKLPLWLLKAKYLPPVHQRGLTRLSTHT